MNNKIRSIIGLASVLRHEKGRRCAKLLSAALRGGAYAERVSFSDGALETGQSHECSSDLERYFDANAVGRGIWKWRHYFHIYERHLSRFREKKINLCEVGIYSGGSLGMWIDYFGDGCQVYGVDIEPACKSYEGEQATVLIGDQASREFWQTVRTSVPRFDIVIDDGGHEPEQQIVTLEETLPHIKPGGVYICEDVHGRHNEYAAYVRGLADTLNAYDAVESPEIANVGTCCQPNAFQRQISSVHTYPFVTVIEKRDRQIDRLVSLKHGTEWQPFL